MNLRRLKLPPLNALKAFYAASRHNSIRSAADELLVTPQAVSQQIKLLEEILEVQLFERKGRTIEPTDAALLLARYVDAGFEEFQEGIRRVTNKKYKNRITLNVSPYFATRHLMHRLERFRENVPGCDLRMTTMVDTPEFSRDDIDVAVQWGYGDWGNLDATLLLKDHKVICCTPELAERLSSPADLSGMTLLHPVLQNSLWTDILEHLQVDFSEQTEEIAFHDAATMRRAAMSGLGVGLISVIDAIQDVKAGYLQAPLGFNALDGLPDEKIPGFYLVLPKAHKRVAGIHKFCDWILSENWDEEVAEPVLKAK